jgi:hypothetical protein
MQVSRVQQHQIQQYNSEQVQLQQKREQDYQKVIEKRRLEDIVAERVSRNLRLGLDKGRSVDIEC